MLLKKILFKLKIMINDYLYLNILITKIYDLFLDIINSEKF